MPPPPEPNDPTAATLPTVARAAPGRQPRLLVTLLLAQWRHHPGQALLALLAIALGVALAFAVHLINASALAEFGQAVRAVNGQPDAVLRPAEGTRLDEAAYPRAALHPQVALASPVLEIDTQTLATPPGGGSGGASAPPRAGLTRGARQAVRVLGIDALRAPAVAPDLLPRPRDGADRLALLDPDRVFLNPAAQRLWGHLPAAVQLQAGERLLTLPVAGSVAAAGPPLVVMDLAGAQQHFGRLGQLSRIDLRLASEIGRAHV
jgi:putative ABC transport system permease protein